MLKKNNCLEVPSLLLTPFSLAKSRASRLHQAATAGSIPRQRARLQELSCYLQSHAGGILRQKLPGCICVKISPPVFTAPKLGLLRSGLFHSDVPDRLTTPETGTLQPHCHHNTIKCFLNSQGSAGADSTAPSQRASRSGAPH